MTDRYSPTRRQRAHYDALSDLWRDIVADTRHPELFRGRLPQGWRDIDERPVPETVRVTLRIDKDVARFFRSFGRGHQSIMNRALRAFMLSRISELMSVVEKEQVTPLSDEELEAAEMERIMASELEHMRRRRLGKRASKARAERADEHARQEVLSEIAGMLGGP